MGVGESGRGRGLEGESGRGRGQEGESGRCGEWARVGVGKSGRGRELVRARVGEGESW